MRLPIMSFLLVAMMLMPELTFGQSQQQLLNPTQGEYSVIKSKNSEQFVFPYSSSNSDRMHPFVYTFDTPKVTNWILTIQDNDGWSRDEPLIVAHANNQGLTITNGKRIIIDRLSINDFSLASIAVYGKEDLDSAVNTYKGNISFNVIYGSPADSPLYYFPLAMIVGIGGLVAGLLVFKKRKTSSEEQTQHQ